MSSVSPYPLEMRSQAIALYQRELNAERVASILATEYGDSAPASRTVQMWCARLRQLAAYNDEDRRLLDEDYRIAQRAGELIHDALDTIQEQGSAAKHLTQLVIARGVSLDKIDRAIHSSTTPQAGVYVIVVGHQSPDPAD